MDDAKQATRAELAKGARKHYEELSTTDWLSTIPQAIDAWEREPTLRAENEQLREFAEVFAEWAELHQYLWSTWDTDEQLREDEGWAGLITAARTALQREQSA